MEFGKGVLCRSCGANLTETSPGSYVRKMDEAHGVIERIYRNVLSGAPLDAGLLGEATGTQFRRFVDDLVLILVWYPSPELSPRLTDPRILYLSFRQEILRIIEALVLNATPASQPRARSKKFQEGLKALDARLRASLSTGCRVDRKRQRTLATRSPSPP